MSTPLTIPSTPPTTTESSTATGSERSLETSCWATTTEQTMTMLPTETSMPPVMLMTVIPMPMSATGAVATNSGTIDPLVRNAGVASESSEEHTSELQSRHYLACRLLLEKKS